MDMETNLVEFLEKFLSERVSEYLERKLSWNCIIENKILKWIPEETPGEILEDYLDEELLENFESKSPGSSSDHHIPAKNHSDVFDKNIWRKACTNFNTNPWKNFRKNPWKTPGGISRDVFKETCLLVSRWIVWETPACTMQEFRVSKIIQIQLMKIKKNYSSHFFNFENQSNDSS